MKLQPGTSEMKEILETNLEQINLQVNTWRPRNAVECSLSSPTAFQTSAMRWGDTFGWWWQGSSLHRLLREALWAANYWEQSLVPYWTCQPEAPRGRNLLSVLTDTTPKMCAHQTFPRDGGSCCDSACNVRRCNEPRFSPNTGTKKQNMVHKVYFQKQNKTKKLTSDRIQENWHICLPFEESNAEDISNNKRQSGGIWFRISKQIITMFSLKRCVDAPF